MSQLSAAERLKLNQTQQKATNNNNNNQNNANNNQNNGNNNNNNQNNPNNNNNNQNNANNNNNNQNNPNNNNNNQNNANNNQNNNNNNNNNNTIPRVKLSLPDFAKNIKNLSVQEIESSIQTLTQELSKFDTNNLNNVSKYVIDLIGTIMINYVFIKLNYPAKYTEIGAKYNILILEALYNQQSYKNKINSKNDIHSRVKSLQKQFDQQQIEMATNDKKKSKTRKKI